MKKYLKSIIGVLVVLMLLTSTCFAGNQARWGLLNDADGTALSDYSLTSGSAVYSETMTVKNNVGFSTILITEDKAGGAGDVDVSVEYSIDGSSWHTAYTTNMSGTITAEGNIVTALQNVTRWIPHTVRLSEFMRYKFDPDADSQITVYFIFQDN